jgi:16S rRNA (cytosine1402-N4)-methyltransferase
MHIPVLQKETIKYLDPQPDDNFIDCTVGGGGHAVSILEKTGPKGKLLGIDWDEKQISNLQSNNKIFKGRLLLINDNFANLKEIVDKNKFLSGGRNGKKISGILLDIGFSSWHIDESKKGFSFQKNEPLDMRYNSQNPLTAEKIINYWSEIDLEKIFREYGEDQFSKQIARGIIEARNVMQIKNTVQLVEIIKRSVPAAYRREKIHFATKTFQALRIVVNDELDNLQKALLSSSKILEKGGRLAVISFHSIEDGIVKNFFKVGEERGLFKILTQKPVEPGIEEININKRARSAKLRVAEKI